MPSRLSTSSFKEKGLIRFVRTPFCMGMVLVVCGYPFLQAALMQYHRASGYGISEDLAIFLQSSERPEVIVAGSSRNGLAVHEATLETILNADCVKIPIMAASPWEVLQVLKKNPDKLEKTRLILMDVQPCQFNKNYANMFQAGNTRTALQTWFPRISITKAVKQILKKETYTRMDARWKTYEQNPHAIVQGHMSSFAAADRFMEDYDFCEWMDGTLRELIDFCRCRQICLVLNIPPARYEHVEYIHYKYPQGYAVFREYIRRVTAEYECALLEMPTFPAEYGNDNELFMDYGHMREKAAIRYSEWLVQNILANEKMQTLFPGAFDPNEQKITMIHPKDTEPENAEYVKENN